MYLTDEQLRTIHVVLRIEQEEVRESIDAAKREFLDGLTRSLLPYLARLTDAVDAIQRERSNRER